MQKTKKSILIDVNPSADINKTGVGYYVNNLISTKCFYSNPDNKLTGFYFNFLNKQNDRNVSSNNLTIYKITKIPSKIIGVFKLLGSQPYLELFVPKRFDFIIYSNYVALPSAVKTPFAVIIYDLGFMDHPDYIHAKNLKYLQRFSTKSIKKADLIITISNFTKDRLEYLFPETKNRIIVTPIPPPSLSIKRSKLNQRLQNLGIENEKYILFVGTIEPRKNISNLIKAYTLLPEKIKKTYSLVLVGGKGWKDESILEEIREAKLKNEKIIQTGYVSDEEKNSLYSNASIFVLPSHYEGFGMPILEAMQYKIPIALSDIPVFREVASSAAVYFDKDNPSDIASKINVLIEKEPLRKKIVAQYPKQLSKYSWNDNSNTILSAIDKILKKGNK